MGVFSKYGIQNIFSGHFMRRLKPLFFQSISRVLPQGLSFVVGVLIVRYCGITIMGKYATILAFLGMTFGVIASGLKTNYLRSGNIRLFRSSMYAQYLGALFTTLLIIPLYICFKNESFIAVFFLLISVLFTRISDLYIVKLRFLNKDKFAILPKLLPPTLICAGIFVFKPKSFIIFALLVAVAWGSILIFIFKGINITKKMYVSWSSIKTVLFSSIVLSGTTLATQIYGNIDQLMIGSFLGDDSSGVYKIAVSFSAIATPMVGVFSFIYLSRINRLINIGNGKELIRLFRIQVLINFIVGLVFFGLCFFLLSIIIPFVYGEETIGAVRPSIILSFGVSINVITTVLSYSLLALKEEKKIFIFAVIGAIVNTILNYLLIPILKIEGAAWASVITQITILILLSFHFYKKRKPVFA